MTKQQIPREYTIKWLHIAMAMLHNNIRRDIESLMSLNHQTENFDKMERIYQDKVIDDLNLLLDGLEPNYVEVLK